jgi:hypothetical protein
MNILQNLKSCVVHRNAFFHHLFDFINTYGLTNYSFGIEKQNLLKMGALNESYQNYYVTSQFGLSE